MRFNKYGISTPYISRRFINRDPFSPFAWSARQQLVYNNYQTHINRHIGTPTKEVKRQIDWSLNNNKF